MKSINVLIFTYKQQELIKRALDSILTQKEFGLNRIIVNDDCSPDDTWSVLLSYKDKYSDLIEIHRNEKNLGVYGNWNKMIERKGDADIYYLMAGDDAFCGGILNEVQETIKRESINCLEPAALYFDWKHVNPEGKEIIVKNNAVSNNSDVFGLKLRNRISNRSCFVTRGIMNQYREVDLSKGIALSETLADMQYSVQKKKNYYTNFLGTIYYSGVGVSTKLFSRDYYNEAVIAYNSLMTLFDLSIRDKFWILYCIYFHKLGIERSFLNAIKAIWYYILGVKYGPLRKIRSELADFILLLRK